VHIQAEARAHHSTVAGYENLEKDEEAPMSSGMGSKLACMYKRKKGALGKVGYMRVY